MKKTVYIAILLSIVLNTRAQEGLIGINLGTNMPKSDFASTESLFSSGYALSGFSIEFDGTYFPVTFAGVGGVLGFGSLITSSDSYIDRFIGYIDNHGSLGSLNIPDADQFTSSAAFWNYVNLLGGPELSAKIGQFRAGVRVLGGFSLLVSPKREILFDNGTDMIKTTTRGNDISLVYMYGGNLIYTLGSGTALKLSGEYYNTRADYKFDLEVDSPVVTLSENLKKTINIQYLIVSLGLSYSF